jgi:uncharacterized membrane protein
MSVNRVVEIKEKSKSFIVSITSIMMALVTVVTITFSVYIPSSNGFFNIGESIVYLTAILFGPIIGAIAGGVGSMFADIILGYTHYALGTLIIKGIEGLVVGLVYRYIFQSGKKEQHRKPLILILAISISLAILVIGLVYYSAEAYLGGGPGSSWWSIITSFNYLVWVIISLISFAAIMLVNKFADENVADKIIAMLCGGVVIVLGYFLYATLILGNFSAYIEIPFNFLQCLMGIIISIPLIEPIRKMLKLN